MVRPLLLLVFVCGILGASALKLKNNRELKKLNPHDGKPEDAKLVQPIHKDAMGKRRKLMKKFHMNQEEIMKKGGEIGMKMVGVKCEQECSADEQCVEIPGKQVAECIKIPKLMKKIHRQYRKFMRLHPDMRAEKRHNMKAFKKSHFHMRQAKENKLSEKMNRKFEKKGNKKLKMRHMNNQDLLEHAPDLSMLLEKAEFMPVDHKKFHKRGKFHKGQHKLNKVQ